MITDIYELLDNFHRILTNVFIIYRKYYFQVKRLEDGFDLSGPECPKLDHPPLKAVSNFNDSSVMQRFNALLIIQRPTLMYDGLHDRPLKHYFSPHDVRTVLTQFKTVSDGIIFN